MSQGMIQMPSFQLSVTPHRRAAARFVDGVRRSLQRAFAEEPDVSQTDIANALGVHRSVINRQLRGYKDMTLSRVAEIAWALGREPHFELAEPAELDGANTPQLTHVAPSVTSVTVAGTSTNFTTWDAPAQRKTLVLATSDA